MQVLRLECVKFLFFLHTDCGRIQKKERHFCAFGRRKNVFFVSRSSLGHVLVFLAAGARLRVALLSVFSRCSLGGKSNLFAKKSLKSCICAVFGVSSTYSPLFSTGAPSKVQSRPAAHMQGMGVFASTMYSV